METVASCVIPYLHDSARNSVSLVCGRCYIDDLADAFSHAVKLEHLSGALYREGMEYGSFKFPSTIRSLGIYNFSETSLPFVYPLLNQLRELKFTCKDVKEDCYCFFIQRCPNLEVLYTKDVCGDKGLQVIRTNLKNLRVLYLRVGKDKYDIETDSPIDDGIRAILIGCTKLERLSIDLDGEILTNVEKSLPGPIPPIINGVQIHLFDLYKLIEGLGGYLSVYFENEFGTIGEILGLSKQDGEEIKRCYINYLDIFTRGSVEGLKALSMGCPRLRKLELERCDFSNQDIASFWFNVPSLRYIWVLDKDYETVLALTRPDFSSSTVEAQGPYATLAEKLDRQVLHRGIIGSVKSILRQANVNVTLRQLISKLLMISPVLLAVLELYWDRKKRSCNQELASIVI
ncbi:hypothetical protein Tco_0072986 [Tanacetum coccineum]